MNSAKQFRVVLVAAPDLKTARKLARTALKLRLAACANLVPKIESHYWWEGNLEQAAEVLLIFKTTLKRLARLERLILAEHPYQTPEIIALPVSSGTRNCLEWWSVETGKAH
jgi:periplasmic divalent cation tolerance protein